MLHADLVKCHWKAKEMCGPWAMGPGAGLVLQLIVTEHARAATVDFSSLGTPVCREREVYDLCGDK